MFLNRRPPSISLPLQLPGRGHRQGGAGLGGGETGARGRGPRAGGGERRGESGSTASERRGGAGDRGHARQPSREATAVSNTVAMATWPRGTGSGRNSSRRGQCARPLPPRARCHGDRPERGCAGGGGLLRPGPRMRPGPAPRDGRGSDCHSPGAARTPNLPDRRLGWKKKKASRSVCCLPL